MEISEGHRNYLGHIWFDEKAQLLIYRFCKVVFGVNSSPFLLGGTIHLETFLEDLNLKEVVEKLEEICMLTTVFRVFHLWRREWIFMKKQSHSCVKLV